MLRIRYTYLRTRGVDPLSAFPKDEEGDEPHPVMKELQRIEKLMKEVRNLETRGVEGKELTSKQAEKKQAVNQKASRRMIFASLAGNDALDAKTAARVADSDPTSSIRGPRSCSNPSRSKKRSREPT